LIIPAFLLILHCKGNSSEQRQETKIYGVKIYDYEGNLSDLFHELKTLGINTIFASASLSSNEEFRTLAKQNHISLFVIVPIFFNPKALEADSTLYAMTNEGEKAIDDWVKFVCPSREAYWKNRINYIKNLIEEVNPDGLSIDFIRHFVFWEMVYPDRDPDSITSTCFCPYCLKKFERSTGIQIPNTLKSTSEMSSWIKTNYLDEWTDWKCQLITDMVRNITQEAKKVKSDLRFNIHVVPWRKRDFKNAIQNVVGQKISDLSKYTNLISPMTYAHMVKQTPNWVHSVVQDMDRQANCKVVPSIQVEKAYLDDTLSVSEFRKTLSNALKPPSEGVIFWSWKALSSNPEKKQIVQEYLTD